MEFIKKNLTIVLTLVFMGAFVGVGTVQAVSSSFKIKENKIFFVQLENDETFTLPSVVGRTGQVYIIKATNGHVKNQLNEAIDQQPHGPSDTPYDVTDAVVLVADENPSPTIGWWLVSRQ